MCPHTFVALAESQVALPMAVALVDAKVLNHLIAGGSNEAIEDTKTSHIFRFVNGTPVR